MGYPFCAKIGLNSSEKMLSAPFTDGQTFLDRCHFNHKKNRKKGKKNVALLVQMWKNLAFLYHTEM